MGQGAGAHLGLLFVIQWISNGVIILNAFALHTSRNADSGLVSTDSGPLDFILLILGAISLIGASVPLCLHIHSYFRSGKTYFTMSRAVLTTEICISFVMTVFWAVVATIVMFQFHNTSMCRLKRSNFNRLYGNACNLTDYAIIFAYFAVGAWFMLLVIALLARMHPPAEEMHPYMRSEDESFEQDHKAFTNLVPYYSPPPIAAVSESKKAGFLRGFPPMAHKALRGGKPDYPFLSSDPSRADYKYPVSLDSLPTIEKGIARFDLPFYSSPEK